MPSHYNESWAGAIETMWLAKPKMFTAWPANEKSLQISDKIVEGPDINGRIFLTHNG